VQGQDICVFCSLRLSIEQPSSASALQPLRGVRYLHQNDRLQRPGAAQAVQREDDDYSAPQQEWPERRPPPKPAQQTLRGFDAFADSVMNTHQRDRSGPSTQRSFVPERASNYRGQRSTYPGQAQQRQSEPYVPRMGSRTPYPGSSYPARNQDMNSRTRAQEAHYQNRTGPPQDPLGSLGRSGRNAFDGLLPNRSQSNIREGRDRFPDVRESRDQFGDRGRYPPRTPRDPFPQQGRQPPNGRTWQDFGRQNSGRPGFGRQAESNVGRNQDRSSQNEAAAGPIESAADEDVEDLDDETQSGSRRRGRGHVGSRQERRQSRWAAEDDEEEVNVRSKKKKPFVSNARSAEEKFEDEIDAIMDGTAKPMRKPPKKAAQVVRSRPKVDIPDYMSVHSLARALDVRAIPFLRRLKEEGYDDILYDHIFDQSTAAMIVELYGYEPVLTNAQNHADLVARPPPTDTSALPPRPPVVTIMGHVDHGKTTILDYLRKSSVVQSEHGGITQHIGAFSVTMPVTNRKITFLDTPGHAAFLDMRRRGAVVTDIVVLVVAADDSVKPQTIEAIKHATDAKVQIIVAINKIDKEDANIQKVWQDLGANGIYVEDFGGDIQAIPLSGKTGKGMDALEEAIVTQADVSDFRAQADGPAEGWVIESKVGSSGRVATVLVRRGTLRVGDFIVAGNTWARVRTLHNDAGQSVNEASPGTPVQVDGWRGEDPTAGLEVLQADDEHHAKRVVDYRLQQAENIRAATDIVAINKAKSAEAEAYAKVMEWRREMGYVGRQTRRRPHDEGWVEPTATGGPKRVPFVVKADVAGSAEAIEVAVSAIANAEVVADVISTGTGQVSETDIKLLATTGETGYVISFNQPIDANMYGLAEAANIKILDHNIIYKVTDDVKAKMEDELEPLVSQRVHGEAEIGQIFEISVKKSKVRVAGCRVTNGTINTSRKIRVLRGADTVYTGMLLLGSLTYLAN
jgi:translation initiation factor IF-2